MRKSISCIGILGFALALMLSPPRAQAVLVAVDLFATGDGKLTRDTSTGLDWLDLTESLNYSPNELITGSRVDWFSSGFAYADTSQVAALFVTAGLIDTVVFPPTYFMSGGPCLGPQCDQPAWLHVSMW
jgi:hypothetical protein